MNTLTTDELIAEGDPCIHPQLWQWLHHSLKYREKLLAIGGIGGELGAG